MDEPQPLEGRPDRLALGAAVLAFGLHALFAGRYDLFRDELYFIVCGRHPAFGYVDQPPVIPLLAAGLFHLGGDAFALRLPAAAAAGALAWLSVRFARLLGAGDLGALLAGAGVTVAPMLIGLCAILNTTVFDPLAWTGLAYGLVWALKTGDRRAFWLCGLIAGVDLEIKYALAFWGISLAAGLAMTPERRVLIRRPLWFAAAMAAAIAAPSLVWQALHGFPFLELAAAARAKNADTPPLAFVVNQVLIMNPGLAPLWLAGVAAPFVFPRLRQVRFLSIAFLVCAALIILTHGKDYYLAAAYPVMLIIGSVAAETWIKGGRARLAAAATSAAVAIAFAVAAGPLVLPALSPADLRAYLQTLPLRLQAQEKSFKGTALPQVFADQLGWRDMTTEVAAAFARIPASERARTAIKTDNYGEAAALDVYGARLGIPPALSGHNQYFLFGLRGQRPTNLLSVQNHPERLAPYCRQIVILGETQSRDAMAYENGKAIVYCRGVTVDLERLWPRLKTYS